MQLQGSGVINLVEINLENGKESVKESEAFRGARDLIPSATGDPFLPPRHFGIETLIFRFYSLASYTKGLYCFTIVKQLIEKIVG